jgi:hypothetical protein
MEVYQKGFDRTAETIRANGGFTEPEKWPFPWERTYTRDEWLDQLPTIGALTPLPPDSQAEILKEVGEAIDKLGGTFVMPYTTVAVTAARTT